MDLLTIKKAFGEFGESHSSLEGYRDCAVVAPIFQKEGELFLLYTQRSERVRHHKGQISFPGGVRDKSDFDLRQTALRETHEEIGIPQEQIEIVGELPQVLTPTGYAITPFVGLLTPKVFVPNPDEIHVLIEVPLKHLLNPENSKQELNEFFDSRFAMWTFLFQQHVIWGATGKITQYLVERIRRQL